MNPKIQAKLQTGVAVVLLLAIGRPALAGGYCPGDTSCTEYLQDWNYVTTVKDIYYCSQGSGVLKEFSVQYQQLNQGGTYGPCPYPNGHASDSNGCTMQHVHYRYSLGAPLPSVASVDAYWDTRFLEGDECERLASARLDRGCFTYVWREGTSGSYNYYVKIPSAFDPFFNNPGDYDELDMTSPGIDDVQENDVIYYVTSHATLIKEVGGSNPTIPVRLRWMWRDSGEYEWIPPGGGVFSTPFCHDPTTHGGGPNYCCPEEWQDNVAEQDHTYDEDCDPETQSWEWNDDFFYNQTPRVFRPTD